MTKVKRLYDYNPVEQLAIAYAHKEVASQPKDGKWRTFSGSMNYREQRYHFELAFRFVEDMFSVSDLKVTQEQQTIMIPQTMH